MSKIVLGRLYFWTPLTIVLPEKKGVWTHRDDDLLNKGDARKMKDLDDKHGLGASGKRKLFLSLWRQLSTQMGNY